MNSKRPPDENGQLLAEEGAQNAPNGDLKHPEYQPEGMLKYDWKRLWKIKGQAWSNIGLFCFNIAVTIAGYYGDIKSSTLYFL